MADFASALWNKPAAADSTPADPVTRSLRVDGSLSYLERATGSTDTTWTISFWAKRADQPDDGNAYMISWAVSGSSTSSTGEGLCFGGSDQGHSYPDYLGLWDGSTLNWSSGVYRDFSAWSHYMISCSSGTATVYVNNEAVISNISGIQALGTVRIGTFSDHPNFEFGGYLSDIICIEGTAKADATDFIESNNYGGYIPKEYTGAFGTNGFHIDAQPSNSADLLVTSVGRKDGDTTFVDVAAGHTVSTEGDPEHSIAVGNPFTGDDRGIYFDASGDYVTVDDSDDLTLSTDDWTIEGWFKWDGATSQSWTLAQKSWAGSSYGTGSDWHILYYSGYLRFYGSYYAYDGNNRYFHKSFTPTLGKWHHVAVVQNSGSTQLYVDGKELGTAQNTSGWSWNNSTGDLTLNRWQGSSDSTYSRPDRAVYDFRVVKGTAVYTGEFTPPSGKLTATGGEYPDTTNVNTSITSSHTVLHLQPVKTDSSLHDETSNHTVSKTSGTSYDKASTPYDAAAKSTAIYYDGNDTNTIADDIAFGTGAFTIEFWYQHVSNINGGASGATADAVISKGRRNTSYQGWLLYTHNNGTDKVNWVGYGVNGSIGTNYSLDASSDGVSLAHDGDWHHIAVTRDGSGNMGLFIDGTRYANAASYGGVVDNSGYALRLASAYSYSTGATGHYANCYLYDVRITKGEAKYDPTSSSVTKPSAPFELNPVYLGGDQSGNKNHFTPTNISGHDVMLDTPTKNYCLINPLAETKTDSISYDANPTTGLSEGNLKLTSSLKFFNGHGTLGVSSGKWYFEWYSTGDWTQGGFTTREMFSNKEQSVTDFWVLYNRVATSSDPNHGIVVQHKDGTGSANAGWAGGSHASGNGNVFGCAFDVTNRKMYFHKNGEWSDGDSTLTSTFPSSTYGGDLTGSSHSIPADTTFYPTVRPWTNSTVIANFGQDSTFANTVASGSANAADENGNGDFRYAPPSGYLALCTANLAAPTVTPSEHFDVATYSGNSTNDRTDAVSLEFQPDLVWVKSRTGSQNHYLQNSLIGATSYLVSNSTGEENQYSSSGSSAFNSFTSDGFSLNSDSAIGMANTSGQNYVAWNWKAHQSPTSTRTTYTVKVEDSGGDAWDADASGGFYDSSTYLPNVYMELWENRSSGLVSLGKVAVRSMDEAGDSMSDSSEQTYELKCVDLNAITVKWHYDTTADGDSSDFPNSYNDLLNEQKITILDGSTSEWTTNNSSNDDGGTDYNYSPPSGWANGDSLKSATTSYTGSDTATLTSNSGPVEKYNASAGFSIITYSGNGSSDGDTQEITHSLGDEPEFIIAKSRSSSASEGNWHVYHKHALPYSDSGYGTHAHLHLNTTDAAYQLYYNILIPKSGSENTIINTVYDSSDSLYTNESGVDYVMYAWTPVEGYSKFGKYTGNGSADGTFIYLGFRPAFFMLKRTDSSGEWWMYDSKRDGYNVIPYLMMAQSSAAESSPNASYYVDFVSNGVKLRNGLEACNGNDNDFIYAAFSEQPFSAPSNAR